MQGDCGLEVTTVFGLRRLAESTAGDGKLGKAKLEQIDQVCS